MAVIKLFIGHTYAEDSSTNLQKYSWKMSFDHFQKHPLCQFNIHFEIANPYLCPEACINDTRYWKRICSHSTDVRHCFSLVCIYQHASLVSILFACISNVVLLEAAGDQCIITYPWVWCRSRLFACSLSFPHHIPHFARLFNHPKRKSQMKKNGMTCKLHHSPAHHTCHI